MPRLRVLAVALTERLRGQLAAPRFAIEVVAPGREKVPAHLGAVVIHRDAGVERAVALVRAFRAQRRPVPIVWLQEDELPVPSFNRILPDLVWMAPFDPQGFSDQLRELIGDDIYPELIVDGIRESARVGLARGFRTAAVAGEVYLERAGDQNEINAMVPFCGPSIAGRVVVSGLCDTLLAIHDRNLPAAPSDPRLVAQDLAGEIATQILGEFKRRLAFASLDFELSSPATWLPDGPKLRFSGSQTQIGFSMSIVEVAEPLQIALSLDRLAIREIRDSVGHTITSGGTVIFRPRD